MNIISGAREFKRLRELVGILLKYGFDDIARWLGMERSVGLLGRWFGKELDPEIRRQPVEVRFRLALEEMGPTFVKLGQILATRVDLLPPEWICQLEQLQDQAAPIPFAVLKPQLERSLGVRVGDCFREVDETPVGSASMAQVHRAVTHSGDEVVLKIRKPGIEEKIKADLSLMKEIAEVLEAQSPDMRRYHPVEIMQEFERSLLRELDFSIEARNADRMRESLKTFEYLKVPAIYWDWTCEDLNVQEFIRGISAKKVDELDRAGLDRKKIAKRGAQVVWKMMLDDGFFHADPHPGNFIILPGNRIAMLDFGMVGRITATRRDQLVRLIRCVLMQEPDAATLVLIEWAGGRFINREALQSEVANLIDRFNCIQISELDVTVLLNDVSSILRNHSVRLPTDVTLLAKACITLEGFGRLIDPNFELMAEASPLLKRTLANRYRPAVLAKAFRSRAIDAVEKMYNLNTSVSGLPIIVPSGQGAGLDSEQLERLVNRLEKASHRQSRSILLASGLIVSALIAQITDGPHFLGLNIFGLFGLLICSAYWAWMLTNIWWTERGHRS